MNKVLEIIKRENEQPDVFEVTLKHGLYLSGTVSETDKEGILG